MTEWMRWKPCESSDKSPQMISDLYPKCPQCSALVSQLPVQHVSSLCLVLVKMF